MACQDGNQCATMGLSQIGHLPLASIFQGTPDASHFNEHTGCIEESSDCHKPSGRSVQEEGITSLVLVSVSFVNRTAMIHTIQND
jgi:hypothetical protein